MLLITQCYYRMFMPGEDEWEGGVGGFQEGALALSFLIGNIAE